MEYVINAPIASRNRRLIQCGTTRLAITDLLSGNVPLWKIVLKHLCRFINFRGCSASRAQRPKDRGEHPMQTVLSTYSGQASYRHARTNHKFTLNTWIITKQVKILVGREMSIPHRRTWESMCVMQFRGEATNSRLVYHPKKRAQNKKWSFSKC